MNQANLNPREYWQYLKNAKAKLWNNLITANWLSYNGSCLWQSNRRYRANPPTQDINLIAIARCLRTNCSVYVGQRTIAHKTMSLFFRCLPVKVIMKVIYVYKPIFSSWVVKKEISEPTSDRGSREGLNALSTLHR